MLANKKNPAADLIAAFLAKGGKIKVYETAIAEGANISKAKKREFYTARRSAQRARRDYFGA